MTLEHDINTQTIRVQPQNYILAFKGSGQWLVDPHAAVPRRIAIAAFKATLKYETRFGTAKDLIDAIRWRLWWRRNL